MEIIYAPKVVFLRSKVSAFFVVGKLQTRPNCVLFVGPQESNTLYLKSNVRTKLKKHVEMHDSHQISD